MSKDTKEKKVFATNESAASAAARILGSRKSPRKTAAARKNLEKARAILKKRYELGKMTEQIFEEERAKEKEKAANS